MLLKYITYPCIRNTIFDLKTVCAHFKKRLGFYSVACINEKTNAHVSLLFVLIQLFDCNERTTFLFFT